MTQEAIAQIINKKAIEKINMLGKWSGFYRNATDHLGNKIGKHEVKAIRLKINSKDSDDK